MAYARRYSGGRRSTRGATASRGYARRATPRRRATTRRGRASARGGRQEIVLRIEQVPANPVSRDLNPVPGVPLTGPKKAKL